MIAPSDVERVVDRIVGLYDPDRIYLFGSYAKGTATEDSDLDLVVVRPTEELRRLRGLDVVSALAEVGFDIDLLFVTPRELAAEVADPYSIYHRIISHATAIYTRPGVSHDDAFASLG